MVGYMEVMTQDDFDAWFKESTPAVTKDQKPEGVASANDPS